MNKEKIREYGLEIGADAVGFASIKDYRSKKSPDPESILPGVKSAVVMAYRENSGSLDSPNARISFASRMGCMELGNKNNYLMTRFIEKEGKTKAAPIPFSYPLNMGPEVMGLVGDFSLRHAAVAAGLGVFGRHNLVIHPVLGTRVVFTAILTELELASDEPVKDDLCDQCSICVEVCPGRALDEEGKTDAIKCLKNSQPYGIMSMMKYYSKFIGASPEEQKKLLKDPLLLNLYQAQFIGFYYECYKCMASCPACVK